jgi:hypothetical protein
MKTTYSWGKHHDPIPLSDYLGKSDVKPTEAVKPQDQLLNFRVPSRHLFPNFNQLRMGVNVLQ